MRSYCFRVSPEFHMTGVIEEGNLGTDPETHRQETATCQNDVSTGEDTPRMVCRPGGQKRQGKFLF